MGIFKYIQDHKKTEFGVIVITGALILGGFLTAMGTALLPFVGVFLWYAVVVAILHMLILHD